MIASGLPTRDELTQGRESHACLKRPFTYHMPVRCNEMGGSKIFISKLHVVARDGGAPVSSRNKRDGKGWLLPLNLECVTARVAYGLTRPGSRREPEGGRERESRRFAKLRFAFRRVASLVHWAPP